MDCVDREEAKAAVERAAFAAFVKAARPDIDPGSIESRRPREPDITCVTLNGERLAFELVELCPPELAKAIGDELKTGGGVTDMIWTCDPSRAALLKKIGKTYTASGPVDLL